MNLYHFMTIKNLLIFRSSFYERKKEVNNCSDTVISRYVLYCETDIRICLVSPESRQYL